MAKTRLYKDGTDIENILNNFMHDIKTSEDTNTDIINNRILNHDKISHYAMTYHKAQSNNGHGTQGIIAVRDRLKAKLHNKSKNT